MSTSTEEIIALIESNRDTIGVTEIGNGISDEWILRAEERLGIPLPETYKWFLRNYRGGEIAGQEIYSIYGVTFEDANGGDIVYNAIVNARHNLFGGEKIVVCNNNGEEIFYFATDKAHNSEYPIYRIDRIEGTEELYAMDFLGFLKKRIAFLCR